MKRRLLIFFLLGISANCVAQQIRRDDEIRIAEGFRLANQIQDKVWPGWSEAPFGVLLVTDDGEFLINHALKNGSAPEGFSKTQHSQLLNSDVYFRARQFRTGMQATFPPFADGVPVIVIGQPANTQAKTSTPWVITFLHEHFHQWQYTRPGYGEGLGKLDLAKGDTTGMWMLNYAFPYDSDDVAKGFDRIRKLLLDALNQKDKKDFKVKAKEYIAARNVFLDSLKADDRRYFGVQVWQEGLARYTQIKVAEAAAGYEPSEQFKQLNDYESFADYAKHARSDTEKELGQADIAKWQRVIFYSYGACEGLLLDRLDPNWQRLYFKDRFSTDAYFGKK